MAFMESAARRTLLLRTALLGTAQAFVVVYMLHRRHSASAPAGRFHGGHRAHGANLAGGAPTGLDPTVHYLWDALLAVPGFVLATLVATLAAYRLCRGLGDGGESLRARFVLAPPPGSAPRWPPSRARPSMPGSPRTALVICPRSRRVPR